MRTESQLLTMNFPVGSLEAYIQGVNQIPLLTADEEHHFAERVHAHGDLEAARALILSHLRYVVSVARGYLGYGLPLGDLIQEGNVGLMKAVKRFNPNMGVRLVSFAVHWIKSEIHEFVIQNWRIVKIATTKAQRKLFFNLRHLKKRLGWSSHEEIQEIAKHLRVKPEEVLEMERRLNAMDEAFDVSTTDDDESFYKSAPAEYISDQTSNPAQMFEQENTETNQVEQLHHALSALDERSQDILRQRWLSESETVTLHHLAEKYGVSAERVRQLEKNAMKKLRLSMCLD